MISTEYFSSLADDELSVSLSGGVLSASLVGGEVSDVFMVKWDVWWRDGNVCVVVVLGIQSYGKQWQRGRVYIL